MELPDRTAARNLLHAHVRDAYQRLHAEMVAAAMVGYAGHFEEDAERWFLTGLLHDIDFEEYPEQHPAVSLEWFREWGYPDDLIHAVEAHAYGYNGFATLPQSRLAAALLACDEICGIFYAYRKLNPVPYGEIKAKSIRKKIKDAAFAAKVDRQTIFLGCEHLGVTLEDHVQHLIRFLSVIED